ncbi:MAG: hypothetical protein F6K40_15665 [Okeania sp. SIO3I5]|uniref:hypothetical protein n=1 Tax=Okeania sp. SIO3I5 TaxID=2607805 RepID=UPI0013BA3C9A|nr:hypothetical protein [Okeania sp. SIO3I5]NEQ37622.1 hypothetical protein [Okeania sp. SIO3I5]
MATISQIQNQLKELSGGEFQKLADVYLKKKSSKELQILLSRKRAKIELLK